MLAAQAHTEAKVLLEVIATFMRGEQPYIAKLHLRETARRNIIN